MNLHVRNNRTAKKAKNDDDNDDKNVISTLLTHEIKFYTSRYVYTQGYCELIQLELRPCICANCDSIGRCGLVFD